MSVRKNKPLPAFAETVSRAVCLFGLFEVTEICGALPGVVRRWADGSEVPLAHVQQRIISQLKERM